MFALIFLLGILLAFQLSSLPDVLWLWSFIPLLYFFYKYPKIRIVLSFPLGFLWAITISIGILSSELPENIIKTDVLITGKISSLPDKNAFRTRFVVDVNSMTYQNKRINGPKRIRLNWYGKTPEIHAGQQWQLLVRLKPAHGMQNPGSFDYEKWLFERGIRATGYVRKSAHNTLLENENLFAINVLREKLKTRVQHFLPDSPYRGLVLALSIGDKSEINDAQWKVLTATGTNHLVAISGLHIGLVAGGVYFIFLFFFKRFGRLLLTLPAHKAAAILALLAAFIYAMLAGFAIPTQRALIMIVVAMVGVLFNKRFSFTQILSTALLLVLLFDPLSALSTGFWLSFLAVAAILYAMQGRLNPRGIWWQWGRVQWIISLALIPVLIFTFQMFSIISPVANVIAVPWVSFITVPLVFLGILFSSVDFAGQFFFYIANESLRGLWLVLEYLSALPFSQWHQSKPQAWTLIPASIGILLAIAPRGFPARYLSVFFLLPLFLIKPDKLAENTFRFYLLDVGQGLSAVIKTRNHVLVFDTGPKFRSGFNSGEAVVIPMLKTLAVEKIDVLMISHGDNDHIGGMDSILAGIKVDKIVTGVVKNQDRAQEQACLTGMKWQWDGVKFEILHPKSEAFINEGNNGSCVLRVSVETKDAARAVLLTGDIEKKAENYLIRDKAINLQADVLIAPHHGSNTSSTQKFIEAVNPKWVLFPAGYVNRFKFPTDKVLNRYRASDINYKTTGRSGAISILFQPNNELLVESFRADHKKIWHNTLSE